MYYFDSRVRYSEIDSENNLTLPSLLDYLQDCCTFQSEDLGVGVEHLAKTKTAWVLSSWEIRINRYPTMGERIRVCTWPYDFKGFYGYRNFKIEDENGNILADANSVWVFMDVENMHPTRISEAMKQAYISDIEPGIKGEWSPRKITVSMGEADEKKSPVPVTGYFIDTNHHMNNGKYVLVAKEYLPQGFRVQRLRVEYKKAAVFGDVLYPVVKREEHQVTVILADENEVLYAIIQFLDE